MIVLVIVLAVAAVAAIVLALVTRSRLAAQRAATTAAAATAEQTATERDAEQARATAAETARDEASARAADAEARTTEAEARAAEAAARNGLDADLLWTLEQARSERTWRHSVAVGADSTSVFDGAEHPLREALQVELDAAREDIGAIVELETDIPTNVTAAGSVLVLRAAQELLARSMKAAEETTLRVLADGRDVVVTVAAVDEDGTPVALEPLVVPPSADLEATDGGVRIRRAIPA